MRVNEKRPAVPFSREDPNNPPNIDLHRGFIEGGDRHTQAFRDAVAANSLTSDRVEHPLIWIRQHALGKRRLNFVHG